jgi:hypothetical protein
VALDGAKKVSSSNFHVFSCSAVFFVYFHFFYSHLSAAYINTLCHQQCKKYDENRGKTAERERNFMRKEYLLSQEQKENNLRIVEFTFCVGNELVRAERKESS